MFSNIFTSSPGVWGGLIAAMIALPILIQLINLVRQRTVEWAAMEFLLKSYRRNRNWVWLKQFLLLLSRIAMLLLALFLLGHVGCENDRLAAMLGGNATHHYVIVDDSFSMSDRDQKGSGLDHARSTVREIARLARNQNGHRFSLIRFSGIEAAGDGVVPIFDVEDEQVDSAFVNRLESVVTGVSETPFCIDASAAIDAVGEKIAAKSNEDAIVYLLGDFRKKDFGQSSDIGEHLTELSTQGAAIELIRCVKEPHLNLGITSLRAMGSVRVAETPLMMEVEVTNFSSEVARKVQVQIESTTFSQSSDGAGRNVTAKVDELPTVFFETVEPGKSAICRFPAYFALPGQHSVNAHLEDDAIAADNSRFSTVEIESAAKVLIVDAADQDNAASLALALNPSQLTGIQGEIRTTAFLRDVDPDELAEFDVVFCCDLPQLSDSAIEKLEAFTTAGGGVAFFIGPKANLTFYNQKLFDNGTGILPVELDRGVEIEDRSAETASDIVPEQHPIFAHVSGGENSLLDLVLVKKVVTPSFAWLQDKKQSKVIATLRGEQEVPLVIEGQFGDGRTMVVMTSVDSAWNNWMRNPTFPPFLLLLEDYLARGKYRDTEARVGAAIEITQPAGKTTPDVTVTAPSDMPTRSDTERIESGIRLQLAKSTSDSQPQQMVATLGASQIDSNEETRFPGIYEFWFRNRDSSTGLSRRAINVDTQESQMELVSKQDLQTALAGARPTIVDFDGFNPEPKSKTTSALGRLLLIVLLLLFAGEQILAWSCSYHS